MFANKNFSFRQLSLFFFVVLVVGSFISYLAVSINETNNSYRGNYQIKDSILNLPSEQDFPYKKTVLSEKEKLLRIGEFRAEILDIR